MKNLQLVGERLFGIRIGYVRFFLCILAGFAALLIGEHVYLKEYITTDENSYVFQAWLFLQGEISHPAPPGIDSFFHRMVINDEQAGWLSRYPPAHSIWLMPGVAIDYPRLMVGVAAFLSIWFLRKTGELLGTPLWISIGLIFASPYFWLMQGSVLSHTSGLAFTAIMTWSYMVWVKEGKQNYLLIAGFSWAFLFLNRTFTAVLIAVPFGLHALFLLFQNRNLPQLKSTILFAASASSGLILFFIYNALTTGDPFLPTYLYYNKLDGLGFGIRNQPDYLFTPEKGWDFIKFNLAALNVRLWGFWGSLLVWLGLVIYGWRSSSHGLSLLMLGCVLLVWLGYGAFWFKGIKEVAPVYYYETLVFVILLAGSGVTHVVNRFSHLPIWRLALASALVISFVGVFSAKTFHKYGVELITRNAEKAVYQNMIKGVPPNSLVILSGFPRDILDETSWNPKGLQSDPIVMRAGYGGLHLIHHYFPEKNIYHVHGRPPKPPKLLKDISAEIPDLHAVKMLSGIGEKIETRRIARAPEHDSGPLAYGVKQYLVPGKYRIEYHLDVKGSIGDEIGIVEILESTKHKKLAAVKLKPGDQSVVIDIDVEKVTLIEPRVNFLGNGSLEFKYIEIELLKENIQDFQTAENS